MAFRVIVIRPAGGASGALSGIENYQESLHGYHGTRVMAKGDAEATVANFNRGLRNPCLINQ